MGVSGRGFWPDLKGKPVSGQNRFSMTGHRYIPVLPYAGVSNAAAPSTVPSVSHDWRNLPQPERDPKTGGVEEPSRESERNLPTAPADRPQHEAA